MATNVSWNCQLALNGTDEEIKKHARKFHELCDNNATYVTLVNRLVEKEDHNKSLNPQLTVWDKAFLEPKETEDVPLADVYALGDTNDLFVEATNSGPRVAFELTITSDLWWVWLCHHHTRACSNTHCITLHSMPHI
jgi:hypothetical protein